MAFQTKVHLGDSRDVLRQYPDGFFNLIVTSPPYADARKNHYDSISTKDFPEYMMSFHPEFWRVLADDGSFVMNIKDKVIDGVRDRYVWKTIMALSEAGWRCVDDYVWIKPNAMPGYWPNRLRDGWEYCFHLTKQHHFAMYQDAVRKPMGDWAEKRLVNLNGKSNERHNSENDSGFGRDLRNWVGKELVLPDNTLTVGLVGKNMGHPAVFPIGLPEFFIKLFTQEDDRVLDPFAGSGSTGIAAEILNRHVTLIDTKQEYVDVIHKRLKKVKAICRERLFYANPLTEAVEWTSQKTLLEDNDDDYGAQ
jgi:site-specific DNA-methyltransferase (adenine-specific)/site-specific DNA-methyltransferase (cytosine-N4-specific)